MGVAEGHALLGVLQCGFERALGDAGGLRSDAMRPPSESRERDFVAFAFVADAIRNGHCAIGEDEFAAGGCIDAELFSSFPTLNPGVPFSTTSAVMPFSPFAGVRVHVDDCRVRGAAIGDPGFRAVEHVGVALFHGLG